MTQNCSRLGAYQSHLKVKWTKYRAEKAFQLFSIICYTEAKYIEKI